MQFDQAFLNDMDTLADSLLAVKQIPKAPHASTYAVPDLMRKARPGWVTVN